MVSLSSAPISAECSVTVDMTSSFPATCIAFRSLHKRTYPVAYKVFLRLFALLGPPKHPYPCAKTAILLGPVSGTVIRLGHGLHTCLLPHPGERGLAIGHRLITQSRQSRKKSIGALLCIRRNDIAHIARIKTIEIVSAGLQFQIGTQ